MSDYTHILAAIDFSDNSERILEKARDIAQRNQAKLSLLHVVEYLPPIDSAYEPVLASNWSIDENAMLERGQRSLEHVCKSFELDQLPRGVELKVQLGHPRREISDYVEQNHCDLVVMGSHGRHGLQILLGSTANAVLHDMPCDVLAVKIADK